MQTETVTERAQALADQFEQVNREAIETVERCTEAQWRARTGAEGWTVAATAHHIGWAHEVILGWVRSVAGGAGFPPVTMAAIDALNAERCVRYAACGRQEVLALLRENGAAAAQAVRALSDAELDQAAPVGLLGGQVLSTEQLVALVLIGHARGHLGSVREAIAGER